MFLLDNADLIRNRLNAQEPYVTQISAETDRSQSDICIKMQVQIYLNILRYIYRYI